MHCYLRKRPSGRAASWFFCFILWFAHPPADHGLPLFRLREGLQPLRSNGVKPPVGKFSPLRPDHDTLQIPEGKRTSFFRASSVCSPALIHWHQREIFVTTSSSRKSWLPRTRKQDDAWFRPSLLLDWKAGHSLRSRPLFPPLPKPYIPPLKLASVLRR